jgi:hypothetical protein
LWFPILFFLFLSFCLLEKKKKKKKSVQGKWKKKIETRMEILIAIAGKVVDYTARPVGRWLCYSFHYSSNIESMKKQLEKLRAARDRMQHSVDAAIRNGEEIQDDVKNWLKEADEIIEFDMKDFEGEEARMKCSSEACLNLKVRHQLSHKATKIMKDIGEILKNWSFDTAISYRLDPQVIVSTSSTDYMSPKSRMSTVKRLMEALRDDNIHVIGVWGMAGVGKSTLVRQVAKQAKEEKLFDEVAIANVTQNPDLKEIQREMADRIDLKFDVESSVIGKAIRLRERLTKKKDKKMILVILDDIWKNLDLEALGIPSEGCKVLLTSRNRDVLVSGMGTQEDFGLEVLAEEEAWSLFEKMAGDCVNKDPNIRSVAIEVAKVCSGLPLAIFSFQNLQRVRVVGCTSLKSLFPTSMATCLTQLENLVIVDCDELEEIVEAEEAAQPIARFVFPRVTVLQLVSLPRLKWFYRGVHTSEWPKLKDMFVQGRSYPGLGGEGSPKKKKKNPLKKKKN